MNELEASRREINAVDKQIASLFEERMRLVEKILAYKKEKGLPILDAEREKRVIESNAARVADPLLREYYVLFQQQLMALSRAYQGRLLEGMKVAYCGVPGAFAQIAAGRLFPESRQMAFADFASAYRACESGDCDAALLPIENSSAGDVGSVMDLAFTGSLYINMMAEMDITQNLLVLPGTALSDIRTVLSHPQALAQCTPYLREKGFGEQECASTADAAKTVAQSGDKRLAAVASLETARLYGLEVLERHINSSGANSTRFAVFSRVQGPMSPVPAPGEHFSIVFTVRNEAGALAKILNIIGSHGFNMSSLHSRPVEGPQWSHYFFAELEGGAGSEDGRDLLRQLEPVCARLKLVGSYKSVHLG